MFTLRFILITFITLTTIIPSLSYGREIDHKVCDKAYSDYFFHEVPKSILSTCKNRFVFNTNQYKANVRDGYKKLLNLPIY